MPARFYTSALPYTGSICVSGAGSTQVNGTYTFIGYITDGNITRPRYREVDLETEINLANGRYYIVQASGDSLGLYIGNTFPPPANPYLETSWSAFDIGIAPVPTITSGSC
jgi:hypothetical protein